MERLATVHVFPAGVVRRRGVLTADDATHFVWSVLAAGGVTVWMAWNFELLRERGDLCLGHFALAATTFFAALQRFGREAVEFESSVSEWAVTPTERRRHDSGATTLMRLLRCWSGEDPVAFAKWEHALEHDLLELRALGSSFRSLLLAACWRQAKHALASFVEPVLRSVRALRGL